MLILSYIRSNAPLLSFSQSKKTFNDIALEISFKYPQNYEVRETKAGKITYIDIFPSNLKNEFEPKFVEIIVMPSLSNAPLGEILLDSYPNITEQQIAKLTKKGAEGVQITEKNDINENYILSYLRFDKKLYLVKFNESYYNPDNPFIVVNNSFFENIYMGILNSLTFTSSH